MTMSGTISQSARLLRGFASDFLTSHDVAEVERIMGPAYCLSIGGFLLDGRDDAYLTAAQLDQFPGLVVTVHDVVLGPNAVAMRFTEHGISVRNPGKAAAWGGVTLFRIENGRLRQGWAEEDYFARKRQLKSGRVDAIRAPHPCPWDMPCEAPDAATEAAARAWLADPAAVLRSEVDQIIVEGPGFAELIAPQSVSVTTLFSAGNRAAFHLELSGGYAGGFADVETAFVGRPVVLRMAGLLAVRDGAVTDVQVSADRLGFQRQLLDMGPA
jgi:predicted ester cyclase